MMEQIGLLEEILPIEHGDIPASDRHAGGICISNPCRFFRSNEA